MKRDAKALRARPDTHPRAMRDRARKPAPGFAIQPKESQDMGHSDDEDPRLALFAGLTPIARPDDSDAVALAPPYRGRDPEVWESRQGDRWVRNVVRASLTPVAPLTAPQDAPAVIIAPGGAFRALAIDGEGYSVARWLTRRGIAAFVLKYRLVPTAPTTAGFYQELGAMITQPPTEADLAVPQAALEDACAAVTAVRANARALHIDPNRIGVLGFSAGAMLAIELAGVRGQARPDFVGALYPSLHAQDAPPGSPPLFVTAACDDPLFGGAGAPLFDRWRASGGDLEAHLFAMGGHGFGIRPQDLPIDQWPRLFLEWVAASTGASVERAVMALH
ncbi:alpha/beta hydrolase [Caulobacter segnis]|uniref:alpha/beta hydrolase n=1 Tax=Caulobacter segnis TaxID=88688 RepID=UPI001CBFC582|nr:alpha/beta hydrolase [Caulobacter segnis]UAL10174.1 alpha/beta hydrolase [Caulobacter segnis]